MEDVKVDLEDRNRDDSLVFGKRDATIQELAFMDVSYTVETTIPGKRRDKREPETLQVLHSISGQADSKEMLALMGPSGSGKTSLLNVLAQRVPQKSVSGSIYVDGSPLSKSFKRKMGFVFQDDLCLWNLTARETVMFAAKLRLPQSLPDSEKHAHVTELLGLLGLTHVADNVIGKETRRGMSGGERKRVAIGVELITSPDVLFLDEPTSGLDASTALSIVTLLNRLGQKGMIVICSIHQPRSNIFSKFCKVLLLDKGHTVYYGRRDSILPYFKQIDLELPPETNPADWILDMTAGPTPLSSGRTLCDVYASRVLEENQTLTLLPGMYLPSADSIRITRSRMEGSGNGNRGWMTSFYYQLRVLMQRQAKQSRGEVFNAVNVSQILAVAVVASGVWWQSSDVSDITGVLFFISIQQSFNGLNTCMRVFPPERGLMIRERSTGSYRVGPYFLAKSFSDIALYTTVPLLFATVVYWTVGLRPEASAFVLFLLFFLGQVVVGQSLGLFISAAIPDVFTAQSVSFVVILLLMLFGGFYVNSNNMPDGIAYIRYCSFLFYGFGGLVHNEFSGRVFSCDSIRGIRNGGLSCDGSEGAETTGDDILEEFGFGDVNIGLNLGILFLMIVGFRILTYLVLRHKTKMRV